MRKPKSRTLKVSLTFALCAGLISTQAGAGIDSKAICSDCGPQGVSGAQAVQIEAFAQWDPLQGLQPRKLPLEFAKVSDTETKTNFSGLPGAPLPNAFERPWSMSTAQLDTYRWVYDQTQGSYHREMAPFTPNFVTSYYDSNEGFLWNSPSAPWNVVAQAWDIDSRLRSQWFSVNSQGLPGSFYPGFSFDLPPPSVPTRAASAILI